MLHPGFLRHYQLLVALFPKGNKASSFTTSPYKKRKLSPSLEPTEDPHSAPTATDPSSPPPLVVLEGPASTSSPSPPRFLPPHLAAEASRSGRSPTPEPPDTGSSSSPVTAYAGLTIESDASTYGSGTETAPHARTYSSGSQGLRGGAARQRTASPAKRRASAMAGGGWESKDEDTDMEQGKHDQSNEDTIPSIEVAEGDAGPREGSKNQRVTHRRDASVDMLAQENDKNAYQTPHSGASSAGSTAATEGLLPASEVPSIDDQIREVTSLVTAGTPREGQKGFVISSKWLSRVLARGSDAADSDKYGKGAREGPIGPVDNNGIELVMDASLGGLKDEKEEPFVPLKPGLNMNEDFEIIPEQAWDLVIKWYGLAQGSPIITRFCHNTSPSEDQENLQYELYPPVFTILKLPDRSGGMTHKDLKEKALLPVKLLASRHDRYNNFLKRAKDRAHVDIARKVRVWRILGSLSGGTTSGMITPAQSRSSSPAPGAIVPVDPGNSLVLDVNIFAGLQLGSERELIDAKDETANEKYNGRSNLDFVGLRQDCVIVLEEQIGGPAGGEWVSEGVSTKARANGVPIAISKSSATASQNSLKPNVGSSRGSSPAPGMVTRGRQVKSGRMLGTSGLNNLGNTCYMNSALQCVRSVEELTKYFLEDKYKKELNPQNPLAHNGQVAKAYAQLLHDMYNPNSASSFAPRSFKNVIGRYGPSFSGYQQQDSQEFLLFLLDGLQEDLNRIHKKPYIEKPDSTDEMVHDPAALREMADKCWDIYKKRNDSVITDLFAGMYKSTVVCPVCDKVSIIFDPFNNLTLQLPIENIWSKPIIYFPYDRKPIVVAVDIDKNATFRALKEHVSSKFPGTDPKRLIVSEIYKQKFYKVFDDNKSISEETIVENDTIVIMELEDQPTNWPPPLKTLKKKSYFSQLSSDEVEIPDDDSPLADKMLVSVFHRQTNMGQTRFSPAKELFGTPAFIVLSREEAKDYDAILKKVLMKVATMTTRNFLTEEESSASATEDSDTVLMNSDDADTDSKIHTESLESEDGMIDISTKDSTDRDATKEPASATAGSTRSLPKMLQPDGFITPNVRNLFDMKFITTDNEMVPLGWQSLGDEAKEFPSLSSRVLAHQELSSVAKKGAMDEIHSTLTRDSPESSDEDLDDAPALAHSHAQDDDSDSDGLPEVEALQPATRKQQITYSKKGKNPLSRMPDVDEPMADAHDGPLIRLGEALVLEWSKDGYDALFAGADMLDDEEMRGSPTFDDIPEHPDPTLEEKRLIRLNRRKNGISLADCLDEFGKPEILSENDAWYCPRCKEHRRASKKFELWKAPDVLVIHLKRFSAQGRFRDKLDVKVDFPIENLDLSSRVATQEDKSLVYDLFAVDNHYGGLGGGHYTAYAQNFVDRMWYEYNDSAVSKRSNPEASVVTSAAYLLFYRRRSSQPLGGPFFEHLFSSGSDSASESQPGSRSTSPSGEGKRLDGASSRNGSSSALRGVGAAHQAGGGGLGDVMSAEKTRTGIDDDLPAYSAVDPHQTIGQMDEDEGLGDMDDIPIGGHQPSYLSGEQQWSFATSDQVGRENSPETGEMDLLEGESNRNGSVTSADDRNRMLDFEDDAGHTQESYGTPPQDEVPILEGMPGLEGIDEADAPVAEVKLPDDRDELDMD